MVYRIIFPVCFTFLVYSPTTLAIMCYICGQTNLSPPGECTTQFQYDCSSATNQRGSKLLCRTTRSKIGENLFAVGKECITERDHLTRYPDGKTNGCETLFKNTSHELNYCICDRNLCNLRSVDDQMTEYGNHNQQQQRVISGPVAVLPTDGINTTIGARPLGAPAQSEPNGKSQVSSELTPQGQQPPLPIPAPPHFPNITNVDPNLFRQSVVSTQIQSSSNLSNSKEVQQIQQANIIFSPSSSATAKANVFPIQKVETSHIVLYRTDSPFSYDEEDDPLTQHGKSTPSTDHKIATGSLMCYACSENDLKNVTDCSRQYENNCAPQNSSEKSVKMFCLTRQIKHPNGLYSIEKRCISELEHQLQYSAARVVLNGCGEAWNGSEQYCLCAKNYCNKQNISTIQKEFSQQGNVDKQNMQTTVLANILQTSSTPSGNVQTKNNTSGVTTVAPVKETFQTSTFKTLKKTDVLAADTKFTNKQISEKNPGSQCSKTFSSLSIALLLIVLVIFMS